MKNLSVLLSLSLFLLISISSCKKEEPDTLPPVINLIGATNDTIQEGGTYTDPGFYAVDDVDGDITANVVVGGSVNTDVPGTYTLTYNVSDAAGNAAGQKTRTVVVTSITERFVGTYDQSNDCGINVGFNDNLVIEQGSASNEIIIKAAILITNDDLVGTVSGNTVTFPSAVVGILGAITLDGTGVFNESTGEFTINWNYASILGSGVCLSTMTKQ